MVEYDTKMATPAKEAAAPEKPETVIYESRGLWKFRDAAGKLHKFKTKEEAEEASGRQEIILERNKKRIDRQLRKLIDGGIEVLETEKLRDSLGPDWFVGNLIILQHLCFYLHQREFLLLNNDPNYNDHDYLFNAQVRLWRMTWGDGNTNGYIDDLPKKEKSIAVENLQNVHFLSNLFGAIYFASKDGIWEMIEWETFVALRNFSRYILENPDLQPTRKDITVIVADLNSGENISYEDFIEDLKWFMGCSYPEEHEEIIAEIIGIPKESITKEELPYEGSGSDKPQERFVINDSNFSLTPNSAADVLNGIYSLNLGDDSEPLRIKCDKSNSIAIANFKENQFEFEYIDEFETIPLPRPIHEPPNWLKQLDLLDLPLNKRGS